VILALKEQSLKNDLKSALDSIKSIAPGLSIVLGGHDAVRATARKLTHLKLGVEMGKAIDTYYKTAHIEADCDEPDIEILPGITTPTGATTATAKPVPMTHRGKTKDKTGGLVKLNLTKLQKNIHKAWDAPHDFGMGKTRGGIRIFRQRKANKILSTRLAEAIDIYTKECFVECETETPNLKFLPGVATIFGSVIGPGEPLGTSHEGKQNGDGGKVISRNVIKLANKIFKTLNDLQDKRYPSFWRSGQTVEANNKFLSKELAAHIHEYLTKADVEGPHIMTSIQMKPGAQTLEFPPPGSPVGGSTMSPGNPIPKSNEGCFGVDCFCGSKGKVV